MYFHFVPSLATNPISEVFGTCACAAALVSLLPLPELTSSLDTESVCSRSSIPVSDSDPSEQITSHVDRTWSEFAGP